MGKAYTHVSNEARKELVRLISEEGYSIIRAAEATGIYYPTAKAINKVFKQESRVQKRTFRYRTKKEDEELGVVRNKIPIERLAGSELSQDEKVRLTCGVRSIPKKDRLRPTTRVPLLKTFRGELLSAGISDSTP